MKKTSPDITRNGRILLQQVPAVASGGLQGSDLSPDPIFEPINGSPSEATSVKRNPRHPTTPFDSSMALTILVLLTALFFMGFFSIYIRRFAEEDSTDISRRRRHPPRLRDGHNQKNAGVDPATVKSLPLVSYRGGTKQLITDCPICLSEFEETEIVKLIPHCAHVFHPECIDTWLASHLSCPLCRSTQLLKVVDDHQEVRLDVEEEESGNGGGELGGRSTVDDCDTCSNPGMRRVCSCTSVGDRLVLHRSMSF
ncbi:RING-H2 finger protein ATL57-like [Coffea arabica]|uniref:RING-type E3 ubiquitin transferase n=1 Tax=Coffea arabica TaxID=13443 RepID=A0A6P6U262_COFAR|nr:RING-H2 finger protein ATL57-like [Coffea arabica]